jgi:tether containing UBX domain for GLUT4
MDPDSDAQRAADKLKAVGEELGHQIRVFSSEKFALQPNKLPSAGHEEDDDFYELQPADYFNLVSNRMAEQSKMLKTRKIREAELAAQRAKITKAVMRVRFPDGHILEADFLPSERIHSLVDLLMKVLARPDLPFYLYTVPPKKRILDTSQDFYTAGFVPGANIHFSYDLPEGSYTDELKAGPFLREEIQSLDGLSLLLKPASQPDDSRMNSSALQSSVPQPDPVPTTNKKPGKPKWLKR